MFRSIFFCLLALFFIGCGPSRYSDSKVNLQTFEKNQQAIVIFSLKTAPGFLSLQTPVSGSFAKVGSQGILLPTAYHVDHHLPGYLSLLSDNFIVMMIEPGFYVIDQLYWYDGKVRYGTSTPALSNSMIGLGAFYAKPGSVSYIGNLEMDMNSVFFLKKTVSIECVDAFEKAKLFLQKKYPSLAPRLSKATYYRAGSLLRVTETSSEIEPVSSTVSESSL